MHVKSLIINIPTMPFFFSLVEAVALVWDSISSNIRPTYSYNDNNLNLNCIFKTLNKHTKQNIPTSDNHKNNSPMTSA